MVTTEEPCLFCYCTGWMSDFFMTALALLALERLPVVTLAEEMVEFFTNGYRTVEKELGYVCRLDYLPKFY